MAAERERRVDRAERIGRWGRLHTAFFLEDKAGSLVAGLVFVTSIAGPVILLQ